MTGQQTTKSRRKVAWWDAPPKPRELTMSEASHIAGLPYYAGTDAEIAREYGVPEAVIAGIRRDKEFQGIRLA